MALLGLGGGFLVSRMRPETFVVRASMLLAMPVGENGPISAGAVLGGDQWKKFMRSYRSLEPIARAQHLYLIGPKRLGGPPLPYGPSGPDAALLSGLEIGPSPPPGARLRSHRRRQELGTDAAQDLAEEPRRGRRLGREGV
ncbi:MAG: hypothetical protein IPO52_14445 [Gemmatimonadetes bacterium]|nr:hypothetical protein [Gemmatimonadota bacterium]